MQLVGLADHRGFAHRRVLVEDLLDDAGYTFMPLTMIMSFLRSTMQK